MTTGRYIQDEPDFQKEHKTATQIREDEKLEEHITDSMRNSQKMYDGDDDEMTPAIERRVEIKSVNPGQSTHRIKFKTDPELEAQIAKENAEHQKDSKNRAETEKYQQKIAKTNLRHSEVHQTSEADEPLYPEVKPGFNPEDEKYWRQQISKKNPLPKQARFETVEDKTLNEAIKQAGIIQLISLLILAAGCMIHLLPLPNILAYIAYAATIVLLFADIVIIHKSTIGRKIKNIQVNQRDKLYLVSIIPGIFIRYLAIILVGKIMFFDIIGILSMGIQFIAMLMVSAKYYEYLNKYGIHYDIKMTVYTLIFTAPALLISSSGVNSAGPMILMSAYFLIFKLALLIFVPDMMAGKLSNRELKTH